MNIALPLALGLCLVGVPAKAQEYIQEYTFGLQTAAAIPIGQDLSTTTRAGLSPSFGIHLTWAIDEYNSLRPRLDAWRFGQGRQEASGPPGQRIDTTVQGIALGLEFIQHFGCRHERWSAGLGLYGIQWSVKSTNRLTFAAGATVEATGTSRWIKPGLGAVGCVRILSHVQLEARVISSRYGYEDLPANVGTLGLLWTF